MDTLCVKFVLVCWMAHELNAISEKTVENEVLKPEEKTKTDLKETDVVSINNDTDVITAAWSLDYIDDANSSYYYTYESPENDIFQPTEPTADAKNDSHHGTKGDRIATRGHHKGHKLKPKYAKHHNQGNTASKVKTRPAKHSNQAPLRSKVNTPHKSVSKRIRPKSHHKQIKKCNADKQRVNGRKTTAQDMIETHHKTKAQINQITKHIKTQATNHDKMATLRGNRRSTIRNSALSKIATDGRRLNRDVKFLRSTGSRIRMKPDRRMSVTKGKHSKPNTRNWKQSKHSRLSKGRSKRSMTKRS